MPQMKLSLVAAALATILSPTYVAAEADEGATDSTEVIEIRGVRQRLKTSGRVADMIQKTELLSSEDLFDMQASNLSEAVDAAPGIRVNNECSMCGMKRVMINGAKGEHTTIMVDGVPMHSVVSSYYGMDAVGVAGIESVEIARGSGASLISPEAIGGTINIVTTHPTEDSLTADLSVGHNGYLNGVVTATAVNEEGDLGLLVSAQKFDQDQEDADGNGVSESAALKNENLSIKLVWDATDADSLEFRSAFFTSDIFGGPMGVSKYSAIHSEAIGTTDAGDFFEGGDVRQQFTALPYETTETITTDRAEYTLRWIHEVNPDLNWIATTSYVDHEQDSYYEGFDYANTDEVLYLDFKVNYYLNDEHLITTGIDGRTEEMRSNSLALLDIQAEDPEIKGDAFDYDTLGFYLQDIWTPTDSLEISMALRIDNITANFLEQTEVGNEIDETLVTPRIHIRWDHSDQWTSRISAGTGYRAPLTFFESEHGILEDGFRVDVRDLEESASVGYALSFEGEQFAATLSAAYTEIDNLAYIEDSGVEYPTLLNSDETVDSTTIDLMWDYQITESLAVNGGFEYFDFSDEYKQTFGVVPVEERISLGADWDYNGWEVVVSANWVGSRDLEEYGYGDRYNIFDDVNGDGLVDAGELKALKDTDAEAYFTVNAKVAYEVNENVTVYAGADNLFDYTQVEEMDSPLMWEGEVGEEAAFDVAHIYGPLRGRQLYAGVKVQF